MATQAVAYANGVITITKRDGSQSTMNFTGTSVKTDVGDTQESVEIAGNSGVNSVYSAYVDVFSALAKECVSIEIAGTIRDTGNALTTGIIQIAAGAAGSERVVGDCSVSILALGVTPFSLGIIQRFPAGTRISWRALVGAAANAGAIRFGAAASEVS
jgi:hypothetical protein